MPPHVRKIDSNTSIDKLSYNTTHGPEIQKKLQMLKEADKETIEAQSRKLVEARSELEDLKQKFAAMKQKFESISNYAAKDH
jgi:hypothetical protein